MRLTAQRVRIKKKKKKHKKAHWKINQNGETKTKMPLIMTANGINAPNKFGTFFQLRTIPRFPLVHMHQKSKTMKRTTKKQQQHSLQQTSQTVLL